MKTWGVSDSLKLYNIENWGEQFFNINPAGNLTVHPRKGQGPGIDLNRVIQDIKDRGVGLPTLIRFQDITRHRVVQLNEAFKKTIAEAKYGGVYRGVYPVKVNQMREVVEEIVDAGSPYHFGLEAGSKAELCSVLNAELAPEALTICNGYKDAEFIRAAMIGTKLGKNLIVVVEKLSELFQVIEISKEMNVRPNIGIRTKLFTRGEGKWESSSGEFAKFGLSPQEIVHAVEVLRREQMTDCFKLVHFHIGSQVTNIRTIKDAVREATRVYAKLRQMDLPIEYLDVGGGLGVDYDGSRTNFESSLNYSLEEYVRDVVYSIQEICESENVPQPNIVSESGRALVAHHSVLVVNVFGSIEVGNSPEKFLSKDSDPDVIKELLYVKENISHKNLLESYHDSAQRKEEALTMFKLGMLSLEDLARVETLFWKVCKKVYKKSKDLKYRPEELQDLGPQLADQYLCNFSVFQSMVDHWAIQHLFPIVPLTRLTEQPTREATLADITCDSDGKVSKFVDLRDIRDTLPVHELNGDPYLLGFFLMGAYQDIMGDIHNLFGQVNEVHVFLDETEPGGYYLEEIIWGDKISDVLSLTQYNADYLRKSFKTQIDAKVREGGIKPREGVELQKFYEQVLSGYTYMQVNPAKNQDSVRPDGPPLSVSGERRSDSLPSAETPI